ncbi:YchJ family metal-binding protein, partial [Escherichia coli]|uniref:YchJ family metal-binding protein n=1 Tax=Escherichia coli TaxID=562 RepID=UPI00208DB050
LMDLSWQRGGLLRGERVFNQYREIMPAALRAELIAGFAHTEWLGLTVFEHCWQDADNIGFVSFVARFTEGGKTGAIIERSRFLKENGQWYYIDGTRPQFGRNDPCPCGSGKKFKKCCGQ